MNLPDTLRAGKSALVLCESDYEAGVEAQKLHTYLRESTIQPHRSRVEYQGAIAQFMTVRQPDGRRPSEFDAVFSTFTMSVPGVTGLPNGGLGEHGPEVVATRTHTPKGPKGSFE
ncbi:hypothetical protein ACFSDD_17595 [Salipiger marinus]|uniref:hypothetical protein n=1 Tax=Salipiger marinus TaxID=555512 RepID=UPI002C72B5E1|nr:hypothetical protein [Salipiger manganoxidans]MEB3421754.1 hypothetical protein [Salipiger manganoxidans]